MLGSKWYRNQKARHEAKKAGEPRPRTGGLGDKASDALDAKIESSKAREEELREWRAEHGDSAWSYRDYRKAKKAKT